MKRNALTTLVAVLLILYALINFGAGFGQFTKAKAVSGGSSLAASLGQMAGDTSGAAKMKQEGQQVSILLYVIAIFILATAVLELVGAIGLFSAQPWAVPLVTLTAVCGILVEVQDIAEDGFGIGKLIFLAINVLALIAAQSAKLPVEKRLPIT